jgi:hypothetical protein
MTARGSYPRNDSDDSDDSQADSRDDAPPSASERAESDWLLAREHDPSAVAPSAAVARDYAELEGMLATLPPGLPDDPWKDEVRKAAAALAEPPLLWWRRRVFRWTLGAGVAAAAAAAILVWVLRPPAAPESELTVAIHRVGGVRSGPEAVRIGDRLTVEAHPRDAAELRVYRLDGSLVARCPSGPGCARAAPGELLIEGTLDAPGRYRVVLFVGVHGPLPDDMETAVTEAHRRDARVVSPSEIKVE